MLSIILPTSEEMALGWLPDTLQQLMSAPHIECIVVDNNSRDGTADCARDAGCRLINCPDSSRAQRLNVGIEAARYERVLLHHPRSRLEPTAIPALLALDRSIPWGGFTHAFDHAHPLLDWTSYYSNRIRMDRSGIVYLDHCIFFYRSLLAAPAVPERYIFEDTALSLRLRRLGPPRRLAPRAITSSIRYARNGVWRQATMNQVMKLGYAARMPDPWLNRIYERGLGLNGATRPNRPE